MTDPSISTNLDKRRIYLRSLAFHLVCMVVCCALTGAGHAYAVPDSPSSDRGVASGATQGRPDAAPRSQSAATTAAVRARPAVQYSQSPLAKPKRHKRVWRCKYVKRHAASSSGSVKWKKKCGWVKVKKARGAGKKKLDLSKRCAVIKPSAKLKLKAKCRGKNEALDGGRNHHDRKHKSGPKRDWTCDQVLWASRHWDRFARRSTAENRWREILRSCAPKADDSKGDGPGKGSHDKGRRQPQADRARDRAEVSSPGTASGQGDPPGKKRDDTAGGSSAVPPGGSGGAGADGRQAQTPDGPDGAAVGRTPRDDGNSDGNGNGGGGTYAAQGDAAQGDAAQGDAAQGDAAKSRAWSGKKRGGKQHAVGKNGGKKKATGRGGDGKKNGKKGNKGKSKFKGGSGNGKGGAGKNGSGQVDNKQEAEISHIIAEAMKDPVVRTNWARAGVGSVLNVANLIKAATQGNLGATAVSPLYTALVVLAVILAAGKKTAKKLLQPGKTEKELQAEVEKARQEGGDEAAEEVRKRQQESARRRAQQVEDALERARQDGAQTENAPEVEDDEWDEWDGADQDQGQGEDQGQGDGQADDQGDGQPVGQAEGDGQGQDDGEGDQAAEQQGDTGENDSWGGSSEESPADPDQTEGLGETEGSPDEGSDESGQVDRGEFPEQSPQGEEAPNQDTPGQPLPPPPPEPVPIAPNRENPTPGAPAVPGAPAPGAPVVPGAPAPQEPFPGSDAPGGEIPQVPPPALRPLPRPVPAVPPPALRAPLKRVPALLFLDLLFPGVLDCALTGTITSECENFLFPEVNPSDNMIADEHTTEPEDQGDAHQDDDAYQEDEGGGEEYAEDEGGGEEYAEDEGGEEYQEPAPEPEYQEPAPAPEPEASPAPAPEPDPYVESPENHDGVGAALIDAGPNPEQLA